MDTERNCVWDGDRRFLQRHSKRSRYKVWSSGYSKDENRQLPVGKGKATGMMK